MNREQRDLNVIEFTAPAGGVTGGKMYRVGNLVVVAMGGLRDILEGDDALGILRIHTTLDAKTGETWAVGDDLYFDDATSALTKTNSGALLRVAKATAVKGIDDATNWAVFDGGVAAEAGVPGDIQAIVTAAGSGLTGGTTSGAATLACDFGTGSGKVCQGNDARLSDARTPSAHAASHATGQADAIAPSDIGAATAAQGSKADAATPAADLASFADEAKGSALTGVATALAALFGLTADADKKVSSVLNSIATYLFTTLRATTAEAGAYLLGILEATATGLGLDASHRTVGDAIDAIVTALSGKASSADLASTANAKGASLIKIEDIANLFTPEDLEAALAELAGRFYKLTRKTVTIALGAGSGASAADPTLVGATVLSWAPLTGNDQIPVSCVVGGDGAITCTVGGNETAEATFAVWLSKA